MVGRVVPAIIVGCMVTAGAVGCSTDADQPRGSIEPVDSSTTLPPPSNGWSVEFDGLDPDSLCARGLVQFCPPPAPEAPVEVPATSPPDPCAGNEVCAAFATPDGRVMPGAKPPDVPQVVVVPGDDYSAWDRSREPVPYVDIPPPPTTAPPPPVIR